MKETVIQFRADQSKVNAVRIFLADKSVDIESELADYIDVLYKKYVPQAVRDYIEKSEQTSQEENREKRGEKKRIKRPVSDDDQGVGKDASPEK